jgi:prepilin-type N-terminal cleavage/methylation domain-containing protein
MAREFRPRDERGFTLGEMMIAMALMLIICGAITGALIQMTNTQRTIFNRTEMHSGVRGATELLQQEVGQAGRIALPTAVTLTAGVALGTQSPTVTSSTGMFVGEQLVVGVSDKVETVTVTAVGTSPASFTASFSQPHNSGDPVSAMGGFAYGIIPPSVTNGSTDWILKMFGDINGDGNMVYVEYKCDTAAGNLYRNSVTWTPSVTTKPTVGAAQVLLNNITQNPGNAACFTYQTEPGGTWTFVTDVAITLTVQTQQIDAYTKGKQTETKALLNVTPRNIFNVWQLAGQGITSRIQALPTNVTTNLLP